jgi:pyridoxine 5-phosphate synthase
MSTSLSINLNKVALVRNTRSLGIPSVLFAAALCLDAGAHGITVHPRPDQRHIRPQDVQANAERLLPVIRRIKELGVRVSLFMDPEPDMMAAAKAVGADRIELYTEGYAASRGTSKADAVLELYAEAARAAQAAGLEVNAGHDLSRDNLTDFLRAARGVREVSIGHAFVSDALELGYAAATRDYLRCIREAA